MLLSRYFPVELINDAHKSTHYRSLLDAARINRHTALPGLPLRHMAQVPAEVPVRPNTYYFSIDNKGVLYEAMLKAQAIAIYAPSGIDGLKLELFGISAGASQ